VERSTNAIGRWVDGTSRGGPPTGWEVGVVVHPNTTQRLLVAARRIVDGRVSTLSVRLYDVVRPHTDDEVRAMILRRWDLEDDPPPAAVRLAAALLVTEGWRSP
jgi:hypothetical protein